MFDPMHEKLDVFPVWVRAPGLPFFLWEESVFMAIGNRLGTYLETDRSFLETNNRSMARILVNLKPSGGLPEKIILQYKEFTFEQILDYEFLPFRCHRCHVYGHLAKDCPLGRRRQRFLRTKGRLDSSLTWSQYLNNEAAANPKKEPRDSEMHQGIHVQDVDF